MKKGFLFFLLLICASVYAHEYHFRLLPGDYNADIQEIHLLFQSSDKIMWLGADIGLFSFDGRKYKFFPRQDHLYKRVTTIAESPDSVLWVGYEDGQIQTVQFQGALTTMTPDSLRGFPISRIVFRRHQEVMIATYGHGLWLWQDNHFQHLVFGPLAQLTDIYDAIIDTYSQVWLATDDGIWVYNPEPGPTIKHIGRQEGLPDNIVTRLVLNNQGHVLIGLYDSGVFRYDKYRQDVHPIMNFLPEDGNVVGLANGFNSGVFMATDKAVWFVSPSTPEHKLVLPFALKDRIGAILLDMSGNLWLACGNRLYIANTQLEYLHPDLTGIQSLLSTKDKLWYGCENGLYATDKDGQHKQSFLNQQSINVLSLYQDTSGILWIGTFGQGLYILDPVTGKSKLLAEKDHLSNTSILNIDGKGNEIWLATLGGITHIEWTTSPLNGTLTVTELHDQFQSPPGYVYDAFVSSLGEVWFGTDGKGLLHLVDGALLPIPIAYTDQDGNEITIKTIYSITEDWEHRLWLSSSKGTVLCVDQNGKVVSQIRSPNGSLNSLILTGTEEVLMIREGTIQIVNADSRSFWMDETSGLSSFTPNINATALDQDGSVWIADTDLILHYSSYNNFNDRFVQIEFENISPGSLRQPDPIKLDPDSNFLDVRFTGIWYQDPSHVRYRYMLQRHDDNWIYTQEGRAVYSRLPPGNYTFLLQGSHDDDFSKSLTLQRNIIVLPPFYIRWWFILGMLTAITGIIYSLIRSRIARINKLHLLEKEKTTFQLHAIQAQVNPHFLFNSFNTLSSIIEEDQQAAVAYVDQLSSFFRGALMHRDDELITLAEEMDIVRNYIYILTKRYGNNIHVEEQITNLNGWIAPLSIQLLVENAIKHNTVSAEKNLTVHISIDHQWVEVSNPIQPKFQSLDESTGFGLSSLMTRYTYLTPLKIEIKRETNRFTVKIPILYPEKGA